jgi:putative ABC transport system permease protein
MNSHILDINVYLLILCYGLSGIIITLFHFLKIGLVKELIIAISRMTIQLVIASYILKYVFKINDVYLILFIFLFMSGFASQIIFKKSKISLQKMRYILFAIVFVISLSLTLFLLVIITKAKPWYDAKYFIPISGMILGNSMNACALALDRFQNDIKDHRKKVETMLTLGATPYEACSAYIKKAMRNAALPFITSMSGIGIVFIPGMMTGQLLSGTDPLIALKYQIAIMMSIASSVVFTSLLSLYFAHKLIFDNKDRLTV